LTIWTRQAADTKLDETDALFKRIAMIGKHFKTSVLGYNLDDKLSAGGASGLQSDVEFESHKNSEKKGNKDKIIM
jgi:translation initiation factor 4E